ncbi:MAG: SurA N-terminal domain-containing protein, partial [Planctomycetaceae bacterium]|nr:SurA N-terminal domain-containing protein [Planctomycetaceae bacterium]
MNSPFAIFRKHQKMLTVILTGLAMFAFVILGAVNDPSHMPPALTIVIIACVFGGIGWLMGIRSKKSSEFGFVGLLVGAIVGVGASMLGGPPVMVRADTGNINEQEFYNLQQQRAIANQFAGQAVLVARTKADGQFIQPPAPFGFHPDPERDVIIGELLRREADQLGVVVTDEMVTDYISSITQGKLDAADFKQIRNAMGLGETDVYDILRGEIKARLAYQYLYDWGALLSRTTGSVVLPPENYWDFYQQLNVQQTVAVAPIPVSAFIDKTAEPSESELQELFNQYRETFPNRRADGRLDEGRPGFHQPRKVKLAYVEAAYDAIEKLVDAPTDEEIDAFYDEHFKAIPVEELEQGGAQAPGTSTEGADSSGPALPAADGEALPAGEIDKEDLPPGEGESETPSDPESPSDPSESDGGAFHAPPRRTQLVAYLDDKDDQPAAETSPPVTDAPADSDAAAETPAVETPDNANEAAETLPATDADEEPATADDPPAPPAAESDAGSPTLPQPPRAPAVRELDDELRGEIRDQILRERTRERLQQVEDEAVDFMRELELQLANLPDDVDYLSPEKALEELRKFASEKGLTFVETPPLSALDLQTSEEYPIGNALDQLFSDPFNPRPSSSVIEQVFTSAPQETYRSRAVTHPETDSRFVYWKTDDQAEYVPESLSDPGIREQVVAAWRDLKAREKARTRATELARLASDKGQPLSESFAGQT